MVNINLTNSWEEIKSFLKLGKSVLVSAPKYFGKTTFLQQLLTEADFRRHFVHVIPIGESELGKSKVNFVKCWQLIAKTIPGTNGTAVHNKNSFIEALSQLRVSGLVLIILEAGMENHYAAIEWLNAIQAMSHSHVDVMGQKIVVLIIDDMSLHFYDMTPQDRFSLWDFFSSKRVVYPVRDHSFIVKAVQQYVNDQSCAEEIAEMILTLSGGHHGLIYESFEFLSINPPMCGDKDLSTKCRLHLQQGRVMTTVRRNVLNKGYDYLDLARSYRVERLSYNGDPKNIELHVLGVLMRKEGASSEICSGIISESIEYNFVEQHAKIENALLIKNKGSVPKEVMAKMQQRQQAKDDFVENVRNMIAEDRVEDAFVLIVDWLKQAVGEPSSDELAALKGWHSYLEKAEIEGTLSESELRIEWGKLRRAILKALKYM